MKKLHDVIQEIIVAPELYLGKRSVERLYAFLGGFLYQNDEVDDHTLDGFTEFVARKYRMETDHNWANYIEFFSCDDREAFDQFVKLFNEFCDSKRKT